MEPLAPETVHRSPHTFEIVEPTKGVDRRTLKENVDRRVEGRHESSNCGSEQLLANNQLLDHPVMEAAETDPLRLFASEDNPPNFAIIREKMEHRLIVYLKSQGLSNREVAERTGYSEQWVSQITRQPWFRLRLVHELKEAGLDKVAELLRSSALDSVWTLIDLRDDSNAPKAVRRACADSLLDRFLGRATVKVQTEDRTPSTPEIEQVDDELRQIESQLKEQNGTTEIQHS